MTRRTMLAMACALTMAMLADCDAVWAQRGGRGGGWGGGRGGGWGGGSWGGGRGSSWGGGRGGSWGGRGGSWGGSWGRGGSRPPARQLPYNQGQGGYGHRAPTTPGWASAGGFRPSMAWSQPRYTAPYSYTPSSSYSYGSSYGPSSSYSVSPPPNVSYSGDPIKVRLPDGLPQVQYLLNDHPYSMEPGYAQNFSEDRRWTIRFDRGNGEEARYTLASGTYRFDKKDDGTWTIYSE